VTYFNAKNERRALVRNITFDEAVCIKLIFRFYNRYAMILKFEVLM